MKNTHKENIEKLVLQAQSGDLQAFEEIYDTLLAPVYRYVYAKVNPEVAEDLTEETFFKVWQNIAKYKKREKCSFSSWVYRIAHNIVVDYYRKHQPIEELHTEIQDINAANIPSADVEFHFNKKILYSVLNKLSDNLREAVVLRFINDLQYSEIAEIMDRSEGSVRVLIHRALGQLKEHLKSEGYQA